MIEIGLAELRQDDVGCRVVVLHDGGTFEGTLDSVWTSWDKYAKPDPAPMGRVVIRNGSAEVKIEKLPMDFRLQIERVAKENPHVPESGSGAGVYVSEFSTEGGTDE